MKDEIEYNKRTNGPFKPPTFGTDAWKKQGINLEVFQVLHKFSTSELSREKTTIASHFFVALTSFSFPAVDENELLKKTFSSFCHQEKCHCRRHHPCPLHSSRFRYFASLIPLKILRCQRGFFFFRDSTLKWNISPPHSTTSSWWTWVCLRKKMFSSTHNVRLARFTIANRFFAEKRKGNERKSPSCSFIPVDAVAAAVFLSFSWTFSRQEKPRSALFRDVSLLCCAKHRSGLRGWSNYQAVIKSVFISRPPIFRLDSTLFNILV